MQLLKTLAILLIILIGITHPASANTEFATDYTAYYYVQTDGSTLVNHEVTLTNNYAHLFPKEYTLTIAGDDIQSLKVVDQKGQVLATELDEQDLTTNIRVILDRPNIGFGQHNSLKISYYTKDPVIRSATTWEINIPRIKQGGEMIKVERHVIFPESLGTPTAAYPQPDQIISELDKTHVIYRSSRQEAISLLFGEAKWYKLNIDYFLDPPLTKNTATEIALPPETSYQQIILESIDPAPNSLVVDEDGNWLARYLYQTEFPTHVKAIVYAKISPTPQFFDPSLISHDQYIAESKYWQTKSSIVSQTAERLKTTKNIYDYLVQNFGYNKTRVAPGADRLGAERALTTPSSAICTEFTDSFVALTRAIGIPAREINGYALTNNDELRPLSLETDVLHAWPEFYDSEGGFWRAVDPTWGNTTGGLDYYHKLDYNHIVFVRHGLEATYPYPAGVYKKSVDQKTLQVEELQTPPVVKPNYTVVKLDQGRYQIKNTGKVALVNETVDLGGGHQHIVKYLPPFGAELSEPDSKNQNSLSTNPYFYIALFLLTLATLTILYLTKRKRPLNL